MWSDKYLKSAVQYYIDKFSKEGQRLCRRAATTRDTARRTGNQEDAYGWAVFYEGECKAKGYYHPSRTATRMHRGYGSVPVGYGRDWLNEFFLKYSPRLKGFDLVVVNAVFYTGIIEKTTDYRVISQIYDDVERLAVEHGGKVTYIA